MNCKKLGTMNGHQTFTNPNSLSSMPIYGKKRTHWHPNMQKESTFILTDREHPGSTLPPFLHLQALRGKKTAGDLRRELPSQAATKVRKPSCWEFFPCKDKVWISKFQGVRPGFWLRDTRWFFLVSSCPILVTVPVIFNPPPDRSDLNDPLWSWSKST